MMLNIFLRILPSHHGEVFVMEPEGSGYLKINVYRHVPCIKKFI